VTGVEFDDALGEQLVPLWQRRNDAALAHCVRGYSQYLPRFYMSEFLTDSDPGRVAILQLHKSIGLNVLILSFALRPHSIIRTAVPPFCGMLPGTGTGMAHRT
jgi:hypothetical protein